MVRLWGGGVYEPDIFYDICDGEPVWPLMPFGMPMYILLQNLASWYGKISNLPAESTQHMMNSSQTSRRKPKTT